MRKFVSGGVVFLFPATGEVVGDVRTNDGSKPGYVIKECDGGQWQAQRFENGVWLDIADKQFETENEAFNIAYDHYLAEQERMRRLFAKD